MRREGILYFFPLPYLYGFRGAWKSFEPEKFQTAGKHFSGAFVFRISLVPTKGEKNRLRRYMEAVRVQSTLCKHPENWKMGKHKTQASGAVPLLCPHCFIETSEQLHLGWAEETTVVKLPYLSIHMYVCVRV